MTGSAALQHSPREPACSGQASLDHAAAYGDVGLPHPHSQGSPCAPASWALCRTLTSCLSQAGPTLAAAHHLPNHDLSVHLSPKITTSSPLQPCGASENTTIKTFTPTAAEIEAHKGL